MAFTPEEIEDREFLITLRGYDKDEVQSFLHEVARELRVLQRAASQATAGANPLEAVGREVTSVLQAASASAEVMRREAETETTALRQRVQEEVANLKESTARAAKQLKEEAERYAVEVRARADNETVKLRREADEYAAATRSSADTEAKKTRDESDRYAIEVRAAAEREASRLERETLERAEQRERAAAHKVERLLEIEKKLRDRLLGLEAMLGSVRGDIEQAHEGDAEEEAAIVGVARTPESRIAGDEEEGPGAGDEGDAGEGEAAV